MNLKKILVTESERISIMRKQGLILKEAVAPTTTLNVEKIVKFKGGYYSIDNADAALKLELDNEIKKIKDFLNKATGKVNLVAVQISSSESQIPNTDREIKSGTAVPVEPKYLSKKRSETIKNYITNALASFKDKLVSVPEIDIIEPKIGGTKWVGQPFCPKEQLRKEDPEGRDCASKNFKPKDSSGKEIINWSSGKTSTYSTQSTAYQNEQNMSVKMKLMDVANVKKCLNNMVVEINYTNTNKGHTCNSSVYRISVNGVLLKRNDGAEYASLNNGSDKYDNNPKTCAVLNQVKNDPKSAIPKLLVSSSNDSKCARYNKFIISDELANQILAKSAFNVTSNGIPKLNLEATCLSDDFYDKPNNKWGGCHEGAGDIKITNGAGQKFEYSEGTPREFDKKTVIKTIDACGATL